MTFATLPRPSMNSPLWRKLEARERVARHERMAAENDRLAALKREREARERAEQEDRERLAAMFPPVEFRSTRRQILMEVAAKHGVTVADLCGVRRKRYIVRARQEAIYRLRVELGLSLNQCGRAFNRDHSTALHAARKHAELNGLPAP